MTTGRPTRWAAAVVAALALALAPGGPAAAQDGEVPTRDIIPKPDSGEAPDEAGDRGGALQLGIFGLVVAAIGGGGAYVAVQARRARQAYPEASARMASQASTPARNPDR